MGKDFLQRSRHQSVYYFRRKVPLDLRAPAGRVQIYKTLATTDRKTAVIRARALAAHTDRLFEELRLMPKKDRELRTDYGFEFDHDDLGRPRVKLTDVTIEDTESIKELLQTVLPTEAAANERAKFTTMTVKEGVEKLLSSTGLKPRSITRYTSMFEDFVAFVGPDVQMHEVSRATFTDYADKVNANDKADSTKGDYITVAGRLFNWAHARDERIPAMSTKGLKQRRKTPAYLDRAAFTMEELGILFVNAVRYRTTEPYRFWATIVPAFTGCRIEELAQADLATDIKRDGGVWYLDVTEGDVKAGAGGKSVKKLGSWRKIPIHSKLVNEGFIDYMRQQQADGACTPFELHWKPYRGKNGALIRAHAIIKWGGRTRDQLLARGLLKTPKTTYFHSLRHTLITHLASRGVPVEVRAALCGQEATGGGVNAGIYSKLRTNPAMLGPMVEEHMGDYVRLLDTALSVGS